MTSSRPTIVLGLPEQGIQVRYALPTNLSELAKIFSFRHATVPGLIANRVRTCFERYLRRPPRHLLGPLRFAADHFILIGRGPLNRSKRIGHAPGPHNVWRGDDPGCTQRWTPVVAPEHRRSDWISARGQK